MDSASQRAVAGSEKHRSHWIWMAAIGATSLLAAVFVWYTTAVSPWAFSDSAAYLASARNLARGAGLGYYEASGSLKLLSWYPPLYPLALALPALASADLLEAARWLNILCVALLTAACGWLLLRLTASGLFALLFCAACAVFADVLQAYSGAMAEGLFLALGFPGLLLILNGIYTGSRRRMDIAALLLGLAMLTRYTGAAFILTGCAAVFFFSAGNRAKRARAALECALIGGLPNLAWLGWIYASGGALGGRMVGAVRPLPDQLHDYNASFLKVVATWIPYVTRGAFIPVSIRILLLMGLLAVVFGIALIFRTKGQPASEPRGWVAITMLLFIGLYLALHLESFLFSSAPPDVNSRLLLPVLIAGLVLLSALGSLIENRAWTVGVAVMLLVTLQFQAPRSYDYARRMHQQGDGYAAGSIRSSELLERAARLPANAIIASNEPDAYLLLLGKTPYALDAELPASRPATYTVIFKQFMKDRYGSLTDGIMGRLNAACQATYASSVGAIYPCAAGP